MIDQQFDTDAILPTVNESFSERTRNSPYTMLMRQSKKMGETATRRLVEARQVLNQDIAFPRAEQFIDTITQSFTRDETVRRNKNVSNLKQLIKHSSEVIADVHTVFPLTLFPHSIVLDRTKITITKRSSPWSAAIISIGVEDVLNVSTKLGMVFGSISIASRVMNSVDHFELVGLWRQDAIELHHLIQGYTIAKNSGVNTDHLSIDELMDTLHNLGRPQ